ncbi:MAG: hypothetical protein K2L15_05065, partial [Eubacteriales bacterium]|nr:hypothetical protein [Eubacteriales bacterium]
DEKDTKLKMYLVKENEEIAIDNNFDLSDLNIGLNTIKYEVTDSNGNVVVAERQVRYQDNQYLIGLEDVIINSSQIAEYNNVNNMNGVSLVDPSAYTLTKQVTSDGTNTATITLPAAAEMPENPSNDPSTITGDGTAEYTIKYTITETNGTSTTQPIVQTRKVVVTNYMPKLSFENDTIEYYLGGKLDLTTGVSAIDYEDGDITSRVIMPQIDSTKLTEGEHTVTYTVVDSTGNTVTKERTLKVIGKEIKLEINNDISMENGEEVDVLEGVTVYKGDDFVLDIENNDVLGIKYALTDLDGSVEEFTTAEQVKTALKTKEDGSYTLKYTVYFKDESIKTTIEKDREITISSIKILDPNLVKAINRQLGRTNLKSKITLEDLQSLTTLNAAGMDISYLTGLEYAVNLTNLNLQGNSKLSKADLSKLNKLKTINLFNTVIKDAKNIVLSTSAEI